MQFLRTNTAVIVTVGPFYDKTDGVTIETALTITNERITLTADTDAGSAPTNILDNVTGATSGTANDLNYITGNDAGMMQLELAAADVNRVGRMKLSITDAANHVPVFNDYFVLPAAIYDWLTGVIVPLPANVTTWLGTAAATPTVNGVPEVDVTHWIGTAAATPTVAGVPEVDVTHEAGVAVTAMISGTADSGSTTTLVDAARTEGDTNYWKGSLLRMTSGTLAGQSRVISAFNAATDTITVEEAFTQAVGTHTYEIWPAQAAVFENAAIKADTAAILVDTGTTLDGRIPAALVGGRMDANLGAISTDATAADNAEAFFDGTGYAGTGNVIPTVTTLTGHTAQTGDTFARVGALGAGLTAVADQVWDEAIAGHLTGGTTGASLNGAGSAGDPWSTAIPGAYGAGTAGKIVGDNVNATIGSRSSHSAADVWAAGTRTLTSFGTLVADTATAVWGAATRTLSAASDSSGITTLLSRLSAALSAKLTSHAAAALVLVVDAGSTTTTVVFKTVEGTTPNATNDHYNGRVIVFLTGTLAGQATSISDYVGSTETATVVAMTGAPADNDQAMIV